MENCKRCGKEQTAYSYCVQWKENDCIRMGAVVDCGDAINTGAAAPTKDFDFSLISKTRIGRR